MRRLLREHTLGDRLRIDLPRRCLGTTHQIRRHCDRIRPGVGRFCRAANGAAARQIQRIFSSIRVRHADRRPLLHAVVCVRILCQSHRQQAGIEFVHGVVELIYCRFIDAIVLTDVFLRLRHIQHVGSRRRILRTILPRDIHRVAREAQSTRIDKVRNLPSHVLTYDEAFQHPRNATFIRIRAKHRLRQPAVFHLRQQLPVDCPLNGCCRELDFVVCARAQVVVHNVIRARIVNSHVRAARGRQLHRAGDCRGLCALQVIGDGILSLERSIDFRVLTIRKRLLIRRHSELALCDRASQFGGVSGVVGCGIAGQAGCFAFRQHNVDCSCARVCARILEGVRVDGQIGWIPFNRERHARREDKALRSIVFLRDGSACDLDRNGLRGDGEGLLVDGVHLVVVVRVDELHLVCTGIGLCIHADRRAVLRDLERELIRRNLRVALALGGLDVDLGAVLLGKNRAPRLAVIFGAERAVLVGRSVQIVAELERVVLAGFALHELHRNELRGKLVFLREVRKLHNERLFKSRRDAQLEIQDLAGPCLYHKTKSIRSQ